jgi:hypothetical protein
VGDNGFDSTLKDAAFKKDAALTLKTSDADVSTEPDYLPFVAATGMFLFQANHITQYYVHNNSCLSEPGIYSIKSG